MENGQKNFSIGGHDEFKGRLRESTGALSLLNILKEGLGGECRYEMVTKLREECFRTLSIWERRLQLNNTTFLLYEVKGRGIVQSMGQLRGTSAGNDRPRDFQTGGLAKEKVQVYATGGKKDTGGEGRGLACSKCG